LERLGRNEHIQNCETIRRRKDGEVLDISLTVSPIREGQWKIIGVSKIARDITERKRSERQITHSRPRSAAPNQEHFGDRARFEISGLEPPIAPEGSYADYESVLGANAGSREGALKQRAAELLRHAKFRHRSAPSLSDKPASLILSHVAFLDCLLNRGLLIRGVTDDADEWMW
jgi:hypothetical protein